MIGVVFVHIQLASRVQLRLSRPIRLVIVIFNISIASKLSIFVVILCEAHIEKDVNVQLQALSPHVLKSKTT